MGTSQVSVTRVRVRYAETDQMNVVYYANYFVWFEVGRTELLRGLSSHVMFLARGKVGPFRTTGEAFPGTDGTVGVRTVLVDEGADERPIASGSYVFRAVG